MVSVNSYGQIIGDALPNWQVCTFPERKTLRGKFCRLEPLKVEKHGRNLFSSFSQMGDDRLWTYVPLGPFKDYDDFENVYAKLAQDSSALHFAILTAETDLPIGTIALIRIDNGNGSIEIGFVVFSPALQRTPMASECQFLLMKYVFEDLGYRRLEWKCDSLNEPSKACAQRLGFHFEGTFRNAAVYKGRSRDTSWLSITDYEWPIIQKSFEAWLKDNNFVEGKQQRRLVDIRMEIAKGAEHHKFP
ncbi:LADA_0A00188g1_1 [Lachancea dasiensis]|uniref:LADA_0A00188g1_1 n=1 Tax=Lachancea dasiensis TaxID=1072105 RepID=A0A1G4ILH1_9SACH|nr:LADA_0A00188g1_1 [Lachancea dasiensis]